MFDGPETLQELDRLIHRCAEQANATLERAIYLLLRTFFYRDVLELLVHTIQDEHEPAAHKAVELMDMLGADFAHQKGHWPDPCEEDTQEIVGKLWRCLGRNPESDQVIHRTLRGLDQL